MLTTVNSLCANELNMTIKVVPVSGEAMAQKEEPCWDQTRGILGIGTDRERACTREAG